ncbi:hypothetical protein CPB84DRAFT_1849778 [Gymnopilus junonius]|uniref:F-box domain-containing protein n=1 Tax=Gymnopilus junonius TaxID=109634 RepID=A0A9P5TJB8_GYMJU|nr:hypothetical protein CPB84DRAFT_1849778 [Gymnopilus junonius]
MPISNINELPYELLAEIFTLASACQGRPNFLDSYLRPIDPKNAPFNLVHDGKLAQAVRGRASETRIGAMQQIVCNKFSKYATSDLREELTRILANAETPPLRTLQISLPETQVPSVVNDFVTVLGTVTSLRHLNWTNFPHESAADNLPLGQLEVVSLKQYLPAHRILSLLSKCQAATAVSLTSLKVFPPSLPDHPHITLTRLTSLTLSFHTIPQNIMRYLTLPSLRHLEINVFKEGNYTFLEEFLTRSECALSVLAVEGRECSSEQFISFFTSAFLKTIPTVKFAVWDIHRTMKSVLRSRNSARLSLLKLVGWEDHYPLIDVVGWATSLPDSSSIRSIYEGGRLTLFGQNTWEEGTDSLND